MDYVVILKDAAGVQISDPENYWDADRPWTLKQVVWGYWREFFEDEAVNSFEVLDSKRRPIVELTRAQLDAGASQYVVDFYEIPDGKSERIATGKRDFTAAWSLPLAMALAKEMVPHYPPATGFTLLDQLTRRELEAWDKRFES